MRSSALVLAMVGTLTFNAAQAQSANYVIDPTHTFATFEIGHFGTSTNRGRFDKKEGTVQFDRAAKTGKVDITIQTDSVSTGTPTLDSALRSDEFFNSSKFPTMTFKGDKFMFSGDKVTGVSGNLTLLGKTNPVTLKANQFNCYMNVFFKREVCGGDFEATIDRTVWGMDYGLSYGFPKEVRIVIQVEAIKQ